jgi:DNA-binding XRE family transcriptional regulator
MTDQEKRIKNLAFFAGMTIDEVNKWLEHREQQDEIKWYQEEAARKLEIRNKDLALIEEGKVTTPLPEGEVQIDTCRQINPALILESKSEPKEFFVKDSDLQKFNAYRIFSLGEKFLIMQPPKPPKIKSKYT